MKIASTVARLLLGFLFLVFSLNFWLHFIAIPQPPAGSQAANFMGAIYLTPFLTVVKVLELIGALLLLSGRFVNLGLTLLGPIVVNILMFHVLIVGSGFELPVIMSVLALMALLGRKDYTSVLLKN